MLNKEPEKITAYVTKYALTAGIMEVRGVEFTEGGIWFMQPDSGLRQYAHGKDWYKTLPEAVQRAEDMRKRKVASLLANAERIKTMKIEVVKVHGGK